MGGGPAGLYYAILARLRRESDDVLVVERNEPGVTFGWSVTFGEDFLDDLHRNDPVSARAIRESALLWGDQVVLVGDARPVHLGGKYGYSIDRTRMLDILARRAEQLGVELRFGTTAGPEPEAEFDADLILASDGVGSRLRAQHVEHFGTTITPGRNRYLWLGTSRSFAAFTFAFERTDAGLVWFYAYPSSDEASTCIVECSPETWAGLGLDTLPPSDGVRMLEGLFARALDGHRLLEPDGGLGADPWLNFREIRNATWRRDNLVLVGDSAHTTHFGIGAGTVLAVQDSIALADAVYGPDLQAGPALQTGLATYDRVRRAELDPIQDMARRNVRFFETIDTQPVEDPVRFAYALLNRRGEAQPGWQYRVHQATQVDGLRQVRRTITNARRTARAVKRRRSELPS
ncbi:MAG: monooxygenase [Pseudonocardia sp.]|nr:monooxygenase [Pseudonocardia sp.]